MPDVLIWPILALPVAAALYALIAPTPRRAAYGVTLLLGGAAALAGALLTAVVAGAPGQATLVRASVLDVSVTAGLRIDRFGALFVVLVCGIAAVVSGYARRYLDGERAARAFHARVAVATGATLVMATAPNLLQLAFGWIVAGWCLVGLIGHHRDRPEVRRAVRRVRRYFLLADAALLAAVVLLGWGLGSLDLAAVRADAAGLPDALLATVGVLLLLACMVRSAQVPLHRWLPTTLYAPTPVSAFLHAGMVNVAGFLLIRLSPVVTPLSAVMAAILVVGLVTAGAGVLFSAVRTDVKGTLARSTVAQMGFMLAQIGLGAFGLAALHLVGHGVFKAYAFLSAGGAVQSRVAAGQAPAPVGPPKWQRTLPAAAVVLAAVGVAEMVVGASGPGLLSAALAASAGVVAVVAALRDRALPVRTAWAITAAVAALAGGYVLLGRAVGEWLDVDAPAATTTAGSLLAALAVAGVALLVWLAPRRTLARVWWWAWRDGYVPRRRRAPQPVPVAASPVDRAEAARAVAAVATAGDLIGRAWPVDTFVAVNPLAGLERVPFATAAERVRAVAGATTHLSPAAYRDRYTPEDVTDADLDAALRGTPEKALRLGARTVPLGHLRRAVLRRGLHDGPQPADELLAVARQQVPADLSTVAGSTKPADESEATLAELLDGALGTALATEVDTLVADWCAAHVGRPAARWPVPGESRLGCYSRWREVAGADGTPTLRGTHFAELVAVLPAAPEQALAALLTGLGVPVQRWASYVGRSLARLPGWAGHARWRAEQSGDRPALTLVDLVTIRLAYELALGDALARRRLGVPGTLPAVQAAVPARAPAAGVQPEASILLARGAAVLGLGADHLAALPPQEVRELLDALLAFTPEQQSQAWLEATEHAHRRRLRAQLDRQGGDREPGSGAPVPATREPLAQAVFCIDVRSEGIRRHLEAVSAVDTLGFAGFFGLPVRTLALGAQRGRDRCPIIMGPVATVTENPVSGPATARQESGGWAAAEQTLARRRTAQGWSRAFGAAKGDPAGAFAFVEIAGLLAVSALLLRAVAPERLVHRAADEPPTRFDLATAMTLDERVYYAEASLRTMGLTGGFAPLVLLCGHGGTTVNNPYAAALDCGACGGNRGGVSARLGADLLNDPAVRAGLAERGITVPTGTVFVAAEHDTVTDEVRVLDRWAVPASRTAALREVEVALAAAAARLRAERATRLPDRPDARRLPRRAADWAQVRPEWALVGNAAFIAAPRTFTAGLDLGCRAFLHSYDWSADTDGAALETVMTGPLVVAGWINLQYYFSTVDQQRFGAGSKTVHTVLGDGVGVLAGPGGDLRTGLPWQSVSDGERLVHDPLRLLAVVHAPRDLVGTVIGRNPALRDLVDGRWLRLAVLDPQTGRWWEPAPGGWAELPAPAVDVLPAEPVRPAPVPSTRVPDEAPPSRAESSRVESSRVLSS